MTIAAALQDRIKQRVPELNNRVDAVADFAAFIASKALPQAMPASFVLPLGFSGRDPQASSGAFVQGKDDTFGVVLVAGATADPKAVKAIGTIEQLTDKLLDAICGWAPADSPGVFYALRGRLVSVVPGSAVFYQIDFAITDQIRIIS
jgi:hypothetical protein